MQVNTPLIKAALTQH